MKKKDIFVCKLSFFMPLFSSSYQSPIGIIEVKASETGISSVLFSEQILPENPNEITLAAVQQLSEYFDKKRQSFELSLQSSGTEFQQNIWNELNGIPFGKTAS